MLSSDKIVNISVSRYYLKPHDDVFKSHWFIVFQVIFEGERKLLDEAGQSECLVCGHFFSSDVMALQLQQCKQFFHSFLYQVISLGKNVPQKASAGSIMGFESPISMPRNFATAIF